MPPTPHTPAARVTPLPARPDPRCELTDLIVGQCAHCTGRDGGESARKKRLAELVASGEAKTARYPGACAGCDGHIEPGDAIIPTDLGWIGGCCL